ncbi:MAG: PD-(D/E)XK nuclease family protein [Bacteroidia bacterium]|nr:PD-(D/E)XK nuclease family protein [Bacteroidia bacterium]MDW8235244.1 PD-(D/E)XK nuclease family protein [Bacteroidia bacterium]
MELSKGQVLIVPDPYLAQMLSVRSGGQVEIQDVYTWASQRTGKQRPNPLDLFEVYQFAWGEAKLPAEPLSPEVWEMARQLGKDWEELLSGTLSLKEAWIYWENLRDHRVVVNAFKMEEPPWLKVMPFPRRSFSTVQQLWEKLMDFLPCYEAELARRRLAFGEQSLQEILGRKEHWEGIVFLHFYGTSRLMEALMEEAPRRGAETRQWDIGPLRHILPEVWGDYLPSHGHLLDPSPFPRSVQLFRKTSPIEVIEGAAQQILDYHRAYPEAHIGIWCESTWVPLLRYYLKEIGARLSPESLPLRESTRLGKYLYEQLSGSGLPAVLPALEASEVEDLERWVARLYGAFQSGIERPEVRQLLLELLNMPSPRGSSPSQEVRVWIGGVAQLAGGSYDALFVIMPPAEPLGSWSRPSLWLPSLRQRFAPQQKHQQLAWRLLTVLLWGSKEIFLWRQSDESYRTTLEDLLAYGKDLGLERYFAYADSSSGNSIVRGGQPATSQPLTPTEPVPHGRLTPSHITTFLECPRRYYWSRVLPSLPTHEVQDIGLLLHLLLERSLKKGEARARPLLYWLHQLSRRKLYYRLSRFIRREGLYRNISPLTFKLLRPSMAQVGIPLLYVFYRILCSSDTTASPSGRGARSKKQASAPLQRFPHFIRTCWGKITALVEQELYQDSFKGRADLIVEAAGKRILIDYKSSLNEYAPKLPAVKAYIDSVLKNWKPLPDSDYKIAIQVCLYMYLLEAQGRAVDEAYVIPLWWRPQTDEDFKPWHYSYDEVKRSFSGVVWDDLASVIRNSEDYHMTSERESCRYCDFAVLCDRLS